MEIKARVLFVLENPRSQGGNRMISFLHTENDRLASIAKTWGGLRRVEDCREHSSCCPWLELYFDVRFDYEEVWLSLHEALEQAAKQIERDQVWDDAINGLDTSGI